MHLPNIYGIPLLIIPTILAFTYITLHYQELLQTQKQAETAQHTAQESDLKSHQTIANLPPYEQTIEQGDTIKITYPTTTYQPLLCNGVPTHYQAHPFTISFFVAAQYDTTDGITCTLGDKLITRIKVTKKLFSTIHLTIPPQFITYTPDELKRIRHEYKEQQEVFSNSSDTLIPDTFSTTLPYINMTSPYGQRRIYQNGNIAWHTGADFGLKTGTPVYTVGDGTVALARNLFFCGNTVIIDHGMDIFSRYCHLDQITTTEGQTVTQGTQIGTVGETGLSVGAHLHLEVRVNNRWVDPHIFLKAIAPM